MNCTPKRLIRKMKKLKIFYTLFLLLFISIPKGNSVAQRTSSPAQRTPSRDMNMTFRVFGGVIIRGGDVRQKQKIIDAFNHLTNYIGNNNLKQCLRNAPFVEHQRFSANQIADMYENSKVTEITVKNLDKGVSGEAKVKINGEKITLDPTLIDTKSRERIASVIGHELAHNYRFRHKKHDTGNKFKKITVPEQVESCILDNKYNPCPDYEICWKNARELKKRKTSASPAITNFNQRLYMAWKANDNSNNIYFSRFDGSNWQNSRELSFKTSAAPALATYNGRLYMVWKVNDNSNNIYFSRFDGSNWQNSRELNSRTSASPSLAVNNNSLFMAWKANDSSNSIYVRRFNGKKWQDRMELETKTSKGPSITFYRNTAYLAFKANDSSNNIYIQKQY